MSRRAAGFAGIILFAAGGALLAFAGTTGMTAGTILGIAGLGVVGWSALRRNPGPP